MWRGRGEDGERSVPFRVLDAMCCCCRWLGGEKLRGAVQERAWTVTKKPGLLRRLGIGMSRPTRSPSELH